MTFADIATQCRAFPPRSRGRLVLGSAFLQDLTAPHCRGWFRACHAWLHGGPAPEDYPEIHDLLASLDDFQRSMAMVHLRCVELTREHWPSFQPLGESITSLAAQSGVARGFLQDLAHELRTPPAQLHAATAPLTLCGVLPPSVRHQSLAVLLVEGGPSNTLDKGVVATLTLELMHQGHGALYPIPALAFVERETKFRCAENAALTWVRSLEAWQHEWAVRWRIERRDNVPLVLPLEGNSVGGAFALGLAKLAVGA